MKNFNSKFVDLNSTKKEFKFDSFFRRNYFCFIFFESKISFLTDSNFSNKSTNWFILQKKKIRI